MNLNLFITKYNGKTIGYPEGSYVGECLSLVKQYMKEMYGFSPPPSGSNSAYGYWSNFPKPLGDYFTKIPNTLEFIPQAGDIAIWNTKAGNGYGHIAIVTEATQTKFKSFDQNWGGKHAHIVEHDYTNVVGFLRPKENMPETIQVPKEDFERLVTKATKLDEIEKVGYVLKPEYDKKVAELTAENDSHKKEIEAQKAKITQLKQDLADCEAETPEIDPAKWLENGLQKEEVIGNIKWTTNYKPA